MRHSLSGYENKYGRWCVTFQKFSVEKAYEGSAPYPQRVALVSDVVDKHGTTVADHLWINWARLPVYNWMQNNTPMEFSGRVVRYRKYDKEKNLYVDDYTLVGLCNIKRIECY